MNGETTSGVGEEVGAVRERNDEIEQGARVAEVRATVLVVEDDQESLEILSELLGQ